MFCLSKGLGAPVGFGAVRCRDVIAEAAPTGRGSAVGCVRPGVIAAAGIVALETMVERLADDHAPRPPARRGASPSAFPGSVDPERVETNIVCALADALPATDLLDALAAAGVLAGTIDPDTVRFVTHKDVDDAEIARDRSRCSTTIA